MFFDFGGGPLNSVADVLIDAITNNEIIQYDSASGKYINRTLAEAGIADAASFLLDTTDIFTGVLSVVGSIDNAPGSDIDATLLTVGVTGTPTFSWDESANAFDFNKGVLIAGNTGIGASPKVLSSSFTGLQVGGNSILMADTTVGAGKSVNASQNAYLNSSSVWTYISTDEAGTYRQNQGTHTFRVAASGAADTAITWDDAVTIDNSGDLLVGLTSGNDGKLHIDQSSATGAKPVLHLDQADLSEEFIKFSSAIGVGNPIEAVAAKTMTPTHFLRVELEGGLVRYINAGTIA